MSGFTIRRFVQQNIAAVGTHCPLPGVSRAALRVNYGPAYAHVESSAPPPSSIAGKVAARMCALLAGERRGDGAAGAPAGSFALLTEEEMAWVRRQRSDGAEEVRVVLATRPSRNLLRAVGGAALNVCLGCLLSPLIALVVSLERVRVARNPAVGLLTGPAFGLAWATAFFATALYAALQQVITSAWLAGVATPLHFLRVGPARVWSPLHAGFTVPLGRVGAADPMLSLFPSDEVLAERGMRRLSAGRSRSRGGAGAERVTYTGRPRRAGTPTDPDDYYGLLGVERGASEKEIKAAYNRLVLEIHPDKNPSPGAATHFDHVTKAYRVLSSPSKRKKYDLGGTKGVDDLGIKKRAGVRGIFGGDGLHRLTGDVFTGSFSQRVIDGLDYTPLELAVRQAREWERCRDELLTAYLAHFQPTGGAAGGEWAAALAVQLRRVTSTGLSREVLYAVGAEYGRVARCVAAASPLARLVLYAREVGPHRARRQAQRLRAMAGVRRDTFKDPAAMVDLAWHTGVLELEQTARTVALVVLTDPSLDPVERARRQAAMASLAQTFMANGRPYKGADRNSMDHLMSSLREYQQQKQRQSGE